MKSEPISWKPNPDALAIADALDAERAAAGPPGPHITVPAGYISGLPVGLSFIGPARSDAQLIRYAYAFEQATRVRRPPQFRATVDFAG